MPLPVLLTAGADRDIESIYEYIAAVDGAAPAGRVLKRLLEASEQLATLADRGSHPKELLALGIREYRQVIVEPFRVIYRVMDDQVVIYLIPDGRRDMQALLARRLLSAE